MYMSRYIGEFKEVLRNYTEVFDIYYTGSLDEASQLFYTKEFPEIFPYVVIVDPKKRKAVEKHDLAQLVKKAVEGETNKEEDDNDKSLNEKNSYAKKYREMIFFNKIPKDLSKLINKFLDGELHHFYQSERVQQATFV